MAGRAAQLAREEADRVEAEEREAEANGAAEAPDEPQEPDEPETGTPEELTPEEGMRRLDALLTRHEQGLRELFGADFDGMTPCAFCNGFGFSDQPELQHHPEKERCDKCGGHGVLISGSQNPSFATVSCEACQGQGFKTVVPPMPQAQAQPQQTYIYLDPATGLQVAPPSMAPAVPEGTWAPGHVPQRQPMPPGVSHS